MSLADQPNRGDTQELYGRPGYVTKVVKDAEGYEVTVRLSDPDTNRVVGVPALVDPQAYAYEGVDDKIDNDHVEHTPLTMADIEDDEEPDDEQPDCEDCDEDRLDDDRAAIR